MAVWMHEYQVVVLMRAPVGLMLDMVDVPPGLFIERKHLCCKSSGWRWIFLPGGAALDEAVQDREQLTQHSDQSFYGFSSGSSAYVERFHILVATSRRYSRHVEHAPHARPSPLHKALALMLTTIVIERRAPYQGCQRLMSTTT